MCLLREKKFNAANKLDKLHEMEKFLGRNNLMETCNLDLHICKLKPTESIIAKHNFILVRNDHHFVGPFE